MCFTAGIGLDDMYILVSSWRFTSVQSPLEQRVDATLRDAAVSITITSLTDALAFAVGTVSTFRSVQLFCGYCLAGVVFCYIYQVTFTLAVIVLDGRREQTNRHCLTFKKIPTRHEAGTDKINFFNRNTHINAYTSAL